MNGDANGTNGVNGHHEEPVQLPSAKAFDVADGITVQPPLSRRGHGPGLIILVPSDLDLNGHSKTLDPPPLQKWAEEGYAVVQITVESGGDMESKWDKALPALLMLKECDSDEKMDLICRFQESVLSTNVATDEKPSLRRAYHCNRRSTHRRFPRHCGRNYAW